MGQPGGDRRRHSPSLAAFFSFLWPGLGQLYIGRRRLAAAFAVPTIVVLLIVSLQAQRGLTVLVASFLDPSFALAAFVIVLLFGAWRVAAVGHAFISGDGKRLKRRGELAALGVPAEQVITAYSGQQHIEQVFRGLKDGDWLGWGPMYHWTDQKIRVHAFYCMLGISLLQYVRRQAVEAWPGLSTEELMEQLRQIQKYTLLYPPQGEKGPNRVATVLSKQSLTQQRLAQVLGLDQLGSTQRG